MNVLLWSISAVLVLLAVIQVVLDRDYASAAALLVIAVIIGPFGIWMFRNY